MTEKMNPECVERFSNHDKRIAVQEAQLNGVNEKLDIVVDNVTNHIPTRLSDIDKRLNAHSGRLWRLGIPIAAIAGIVGVLAERFT